MPPEPRTKRDVPSRILRERFNASQLPVLIAEGRLAEFIRREAPLTDPESVGEPPGTRSQYVRYSDDDGNMVVEVHRYIRPDGTLGGSGKPDLKRMAVGGEIWRAV